MSMHELSTALQEEAPIMVCIFNDGALGTIKHHQRSRYGGRLISVELENPDFASVAEAMGCHGVTVDEPDQLSQALREGVRMVMNGQPVVVDIHIDGDEPLPQ